MFLIQAKLNQRGLLFYAVGLYQVRENIYVVHISTDHASISGFWSGQRGNQNDIHLAAMEAAHHGFGADNRLCQPGCFSPSAAVTTRFGMGNGPY